MSRSEAKRSFTVSEFKKQMVAVYTTSVGKDTLDECPMAYKDMDAILRHIGPTAEVVERLRLCIISRLGRNKREKQI